jgi:hypothetical protein
MFTKSRWRSFLPAISFLIAVTLVPFLTHSPVDAEPSSVSFPDQPIAESNDYASAVLGDPWDMDDIGDVSIYLNESGQRSVVDSIIVEESVYSGRSVGNDPQSGWFHVLFPGYLTAIHSGKVGSKYPINSTTYSCFYLAMRVETTQKEDRFRILWFADDRLTSGSFGQTNWLNPYPEAAGDPTAVWKWKLFKINLVQDSISEPPLAPWNEQSNWQGLRIDPTHLGDVGYSVDWVRLTNCQSQNVSISFTPNQSINTLWVRSEGSTRYIKVVDNVDGSSGKYTLDVQGLQAGNYTIGFGGKENCCTTESTQLLRIQPRPRLSFERPSFWSGEDYATVGGNAWDFTDNTDVKEIQRASSVSFQEGKLELTSDPGPLPGGQDVQILLKELPVPADPSKYRFLTIHLNSGWKAPWQNVPDGMIVRWVWSIQGSSGKEGKRCNLVSQDIPFNIGWDTLVIDLHDSFAGSAEQMAGECSGYPSKWLTDKPILNFRFDPNENITGVADPITGGGPFYQRIDWIRLTKPDTITKGNEYPIRFVLETALSEVNSLALYYTTDRENPTAHLIYRHSDFSKESSNESPVTPQTLPGNQRFFLPLMFTRPNIIINQNYIEYYWDTTNIPAGNYYVCLLISNDTSESTICSEATLRIQ